ncbi:YtxH domain-containing protein [Actinacidiphila sp. DG2A-62]|jgi:tripartite-type tricarboxylate transporter receptor subunit TctC|uniref:YtxH domain-containing protein n=1 Tax=Actinacidiphila sp. DG2A-62 TaxID=3108821 RepID=UPI002DBD88BC|nr:YtxH domain-containing protein [Actinacidiphila sp. DG2A-62]MEC3994119.1 YtxH domain-containing protein [Actinacidiphila sp. DG2A-62]
MHRLTFITGALVGYVLGARAGRERYEQLRAAAQKVAQNPAVRNTAESAVQQSRSAASKTADKVTSRIGDRMPDAVASRVRSLRNGHGPDDDWGTSNT